MSPIVVSDPANRPVGSYVIPPLEAGDHLTLREFLRRYEATSDVNDAELIEGIVSMGSAVRVEHASPHVALSGVLWFYWGATPGIEPGDNATIELDSVNAPQPDLYLRILPDFGGQTRTERGLVISAPEFVAEISGTSVSRDLHEKLTAYERNGVKEYLVWRVYDQEIDWFIRREGKFVRVEPTDGIHRSEAFPGLWINVPALLARDVPDLLTTLQAGLATPEHAGFRERLAVARGAEG